MAGTTFCRGRGFLYRRLSRFVDVFKEVIRFEGF
jgi:hypothetical protein